MVFAGFFVPDGIKPGGSCIIRIYTLCFDRANLGLVAHQVSDELEHVRRVSVADLSSLHLESEGSLFSLCWVEGDVFDEVSIGDGLVSIVIAIVPGVSTGRELVAIVKLHLSFSRLTV